jgi:CubicO group peptidase (beta-lactamase class C family)
MSLGFQWLLCSVAMWSVVLASVIVPKSCRPALPVDWFIAQAQNLPALSQSLSDNITATSKIFKADIEKGISDGALGVDVLSIVVAGPWGPVFEYNYGKLRSNAADTVNGDSIYRIASISKVHIYASAL